MGSGGQRGPARGPQRTPLGLVAPGAASLRAGAASRGPRAVGRGHGAHGQRRPCSLLHHAHLGAEDAPALLMRPGPEAAWQQEQSQLRQSGQLVPSGQPRRRCWGAGEPGDYAPAGRADAQAGGRPQILALRRGSADPRGEHLQAAVAGVAAHGAAAAAATDAFAETLRRLRSQQPFHQAQEQRRHQPRLPHRGPRPHLLGRPAGAGPAPRRPGQGQEEVAAHGEAHGRGRLKAGRRHLGERAAARRPAERRAGALQRGAVAPEGLSLATGHPHAKSRGQAAGAQGRLPAAGLGPRRLRPRAGGRRLVVRDRGGGKSRVRLAGAV
mmetsp:Transcript_103621/g.334088  ORF Transcript_103621/g.334088 Transcript_103621/m.334088 type:complete len:325 (-) Transcript_103621:709-1683(-)